MSETDLEFDIVFNEKESLVIVNDDNDPYESFIDKDGEKKWIEYIGDDKIIRNNNNPDLTPDGLSILSKQLDDLDQLDKKYEEEQIGKDVEKQKKINRAIKVKSIVLDEMGKTLTFDTRRLTTRERENYNDKFYLYWGVEDDFINRKFAKICHETIFSLGFDYSNLPVYDL
jgi:hypothetical protein